MTIAWDKKILKGKAELGLSVSIPNTLHLP
jgi:hypothetical protein